jgi:cadmium resistance protein CadD (predicted permease)
MFETIVTSFLAFISTNIDDVFILMAWFAQVPQSLSYSNVVAGQYLGIFTLVLVSLIGSLIGIFLPTAYIGILGLFPVYLGLSAIYKNSKRKSVTDYSTSLSESDNELNAKMSGRKTLAVATITIANGSDNIGVYLPLFASFSWPQLAVTFVVFALSVYALVESAAYLARHRLLSKHLKRYIPTIFPAILILLGVYIMFESGTFELLNTILQFIQN